MQPTLTEIVNRYLAKSAKRYGEPVTALADGLSTLAGAVNNRSISDILSGLLKAEADLIAEATALQNSKPDE